MFQPFSEPSAEMTATAAIALAAHSPPNSSAAASANGAEEAESWPGHRALDGERAGEVEQRDAGHAADDRARDVALGVAHAVRRHRGALHPEEAEEQQRARGGQGVDDSPFFASTSPTLPGSNMIRPTIATIDSAPIFSTVVVTATVPTDRVLTRLLSTGSQSTVSASASVVPRASPSPNSVAA